MEEDKNTLNQNGIKKRGLLKIVAVALIFLVAGSALGYFAGTSLFSATPSQQNTAPLYTFYALGWTLTEPWLASFYKGCTDAANMTNTKVVMLETGGGAEGFTRGFDQALAASPSGILCGYWFPDAMGPDFQTAKQRNIPVMCFDVQAPPEMKISIGFVGWENVAAGYALAKRVTEGITPKAVAIVSHDVGQLWSVQRSQGMGQYINETFPGVPVEIVDCKVAQTSTTQAEELLRAYMTAHPNTNVYLSLGPQVEWALAALMTEQNLKGKVYTGTSDVDQRVMDDIKNGICVSAVSQQPYFQGFLATMSLYNYLKLGFIPPAQVSMGPTVIDSSNVNVIQKQLDTTGGA